MVKEEGVRPSVPQTLSASHQFIAIVFCSWSFVCSLPIKHTHIYLDTDPDNEENNLGTIIATSSMSDLAVDSADNFLWMCQPMEDRGKKCEQLCGFNNCSKTPHECLFNYHKRNRLMQYILRNTPTQKLFYHRPHRFPCSLIDVAPSVITSSRKRIFGFNLFFFVTSDA